MWHLSNKIGIELNLRYKEYYLTQLPFLQNEWAAFHKSMSTELPVTFRLNQRTSFSKKGLQAFISQSYLSALKRKLIEVRGNMIENIIETVSFLPQEQLFAYQINVDSQTLSKSSSLKPLSDLLHRETQLGHVIRQELVSMIPAIVLKVESHHFVLDTCAAPGSKTEALLSSLTHPSRDSSPASISPRGLVVANDPDPKRIQTLQRRYARSGSPHLILTCARAEDLAAYINAPLFDRIVCDVPCTGDGTFRKFPHQWRLFRPRFGFEIHALQLQIALASASLLKPGGRMVYSTCSLNPIENEAVVCALLTQSEVSLRLVDIRAEGRLPALKSREGVYTWEVSEAIVAVGETMAERQSTLARCPTFTPSMHPPATEEVARSLHLERCMRILPHDNNTGGFFIALLEKVELANEGPALTSSSSQLFEKKKKVKTALSKAESLHALRQLGFNPRQSSEASTADEWRGITGAQSFREIEATAEGIEIVNTLGLDSLCAESEGMPRLLRYERAAERKKKEGRKKSVVFATTAADIDPLLVNKKKKRRINNGVDSSVHDEERDRDEGTLKDASAGIVMVSDSVAKALSSWATSKFVVQAGIPVFYDRFAAGRWELDADGITPLLPYITRGIVPLSIQVMLHLLRHLVKGHTISKEDAHGLTLGVEDSSKTLTREYQLLPPIETNI